MSRAVSRASRSVVLRLAKDETAVSRVTRTVSAVSRRRATTSLARATNGG